LASWRREIFFIGVASATTLGFGSYDLDSPALRPDAAARNLPIPRVCVAMPPHKRAERRIRT
jgi:hypothetical protein